ncbi:hypothetical protein K466DRAFT_477823 [Polyporus arcularius HHB13444]|uniref:Uncharacterized protein n=1 Tax=Polyporus arcularius HHB13444 TaxID=1314778 RepID=A0A5C3PWN8_9APHY|nr:hypothetical protein K466DRAFT_477823 [Polyporus arcularius HHB13444]
MSASLSSSSTRLCFRAVPPRKLPASRRVRARPLSSQAAPPTPSRHAQFYTDYVAGMIPVALLGSAVYIVRRLPSPSLTHGLRTWQQYLAQERFLEEAHAHVQQLEAEVIALREQQKTSEPSSSASSTPPSETKKRSGWWPW